MPRSYGELEIYIVQDDLDLVEVSDVDYWFDRKGRPGGAGMGHPEHRYHKFGTPEGRFCIARWMRPSIEQREAFLKLCAGEASIQRESIPSGSATYTPSFALHDIRSIQLITSKLGLVEGDSYTVNWATGVISLSTALTEAAEIVYLSDATASRIAPPFVFDIVWRRREDKAVVVRRLKGCAVCPGSDSGGEDALLSGDFLSLEGEP